ncbi:MAG: DUF4194 domain-containing protein [Spirochaetaceae bacterium]|jgi:hypothetical protein|nr:DUF4194 domain-containing protein [Spirochaetaceae bacterium]
MAGDVAELAQIAELSDDDFITFKRTLKTLLAKTFVIRGIERDEVLYDFAIRNIALFDAWFTCFDATLVRDESLGVIAFHSGRDTRLTLSRDETCALLVFRLLYEERRAELSLEAFPTVTVFDFCERFKAMSDSDLRKTRLTEILHRLKAHKLIELLFDEALDMEGVVILYPSLAITVNRDGIDEILDSLQQTEQQSEQQTEQQSEQQLEQKDDEQTEITL